MEHLLEVLMFRSRWLLAPFYVGLIGGIAALLVKFCQEIAHMGLTIFSGTEREIMLSVLGLVDVTLLANLLLMVIFSGYENFVSKIDTANHRDRPDWMGKVDYSDLKLKLIGSIVAISAIELLRAFMHQTMPGAVPLTTEQLAWMVGIHVTFMVSGVMFALMDNLAHKGKGEHKAHK